MKKMEMESCIISNQKLLKSSKEVYVFAEKLSAQSTFLTSDLILAAVWHCINQSTETSACNYKTSESESNRYKKGQQNVSSTGSENDVEGSVDVDAVNIITITNNGDDNDSKRQKQSKESSVANLSHRNIIGKSQNTHSNKPDSSALDQKSTNTGTFQTISNDKPGALETENGSIKKDTDQFNVPDKDTQYSQNNATLKETSILSSAPVDDNESKFIVTSADNKHKDQSISGQKESRLNKTLKTDDEAEKVKENIADIEVINIDDDDDGDDSNNIASICDEASTSENENVPVTSEEKTEEKEPDYFDMDCDEIEDDDNYVYEEYEETCITNEADKEEKVENDLNAIDIQKDEVVTIISDDEDDYATAPNNSTKNSEQSGFNKNSDTKTQGTEKGTGSVSTKSKRKQSFSDIKEDDIITSGEKTGGKSKKDKLSEKVSPPRLLCPAMEYLDGMSAPVLSVQNEEMSSSCIVSESAIDVLELVPVKDHQNMSEKAVCAAEESEHIESLSPDKSVNVSSDRKDESVSSSSSIKNLLPAFTEAENVSSDKELEQQLPQTSTSKSTDIHGRPPRKKKRLLDHDKKWHMEPKISPQQDKYLALPGGVEGNSILTGWNPPGGHSDESQQSNAPSIGIEKVDSDYMNYQSIGDENYLVIDDCDKDDDDDDKNDDDETNIDSEDEGFSRKKVTRSTGKRGKGLKGSKSNDSSRVRVKNQKKRNDENYVDDDSDENDDCDSSVNGSDDEGTSKERSSVTDKRGRRRGNKSSLVKSGKSEEEGRKGQPVNRGRRLNLHNIPDKLKKDRKDVSPTKFSSLRGRKIGFYSIKVGRPKQTSDSPVKTRAMKDNIKPERPRKHTVQGQELQTKSVRESGRPKKHSANNKAIRTQEGGKSTTQDNQTSKQGKNSKVSAKKDKLRNIRRSKSRESTVNEDQNSDVIVID